ncbi:MAG TPA: tetratricopeptide repeat protein, partial [Kofleriaceae bacterium]
MRAATDVARALLVVIGLARVAFADPGHVADETFERGRALMAKKQYAEACAAFEQSQRLDPQFGTLFNLADCEVQLGKLATAWGRYRELERTDSNQERRALSAQLATQLEH